MSASTYLEGVEKFHGMRLRAELTLLWSKLTRRCQCLQRLEELTNGRPILRRRDRGTHFIPIDCIVGSVGRQHDFTRSFLPLAGVNAERWARLYHAINSAEGVPEVELFQIGEAYVVVDGHHRISAARASGLDQIAAHVTEVLD